MDNNSSDATSDVVGAFSATTTVPVRYVFEPKQGISHARNRGIQEARGSVLAFTDDDILPSPDWVARIGESIDHWRAQGVGGRILPKWESPPPRWLEDNRLLQRQLAIMDFEESRLLTLPLEREPQVWGANMAFRRELFERTGGFDPRRGIVGGRLFRGEESDLIHRALELGARIAYDASLTVFHRIGSDRMRKRYFRRMAFDNARGKARVQPGVGGRTLLGAPLWFYRRAFGELGTWLGHALLRRPDAFERQLRWLRSVGRLSGHWTPAQDGPVEETHREGERETP